mgnify:FL=1
MYAHQFSVHLSPFSLCLFMFRIYSDISVFDSNEVEVTGSEWMEAYPKVSLRLYSSYTTLLKKRHDGFV